MKNLDKVYAEKVAEEYAIKNESKVLRLKKLDQKVKRPAYIIAYTIGIVSSLILGTGMSFIMTDFGPTGNEGLVLGIILGVVGIIFCVLNYFLYRKILNSRKKKYSFEINTLAKEIIED